MASWRVAQSSGLWFRAGMSGIAYGLDIEAAVSRIGSDLDREIVVRLLGAIEAGGVKAMVTRAEEGREDAGTA